MNECEEYAIRHYLQHEEPTISLSFLNTSSNLSHINPQSQIISSSRTQPTSRALNEKTSQKNAIKNSADQDPEGY
jgi:hypothetical protein